MGQACGCQDSTASTNDEIKQTDAHKSSYQSTHGHKPNNSVTGADPPSYAPQVQDRVKKSQNQGSITQTRNQADYPRPLEAESKSYEARSEAQMARLQKLVTDLDLEKVDELQSPTTGAIFNGYVNTESIKTGWGTQVWPDGGKYEGEWQMNKANGKGQFWHADGDIYEGNWKDDKAFGYGLYLHADGARYLGQWRDDTQHGRGQETWADGSKFEGEYVDGKKHGHGTYQWVDGSSFTGGWMDNKINGSGEYTWPDGRKFGGSWKDNNMHGRGVYTWADGRRYEGEYSNDKKHGTGTYTWADGRQYTGQWENGKQHGQGIYKHANGQMRTGIWQEGKRMMWIDEGDASEGVTSGQMSSNAAKYQVS